jgi:DNA polymerase-3 subunit epsilon
MQGYKRFAIEKYKRNYKPIYTFNTLIEGHNRLRELISEFDLCLRLCNLATSHDCDCGTHPTTEIYNQKAEKAIDRLKNQLPTFALIDIGMDDNDHSCILMKEGNLYGMGYITDKKEQLQTLEILISNIEPLQDNDYIRNLVLRHATEYPDKCVVFK